MSNDGNDSDTTQIYDGDRSYVQPYVTRGDAVSQALQEAVDTECLDEPDGWWGHWAWNQPITLIKRGIANRISSPQVLPNIQGGGDITNNWYDKLLQALRKVNTPVRAQVHAKEFTIVGFLDLEDDDDDDDGSIQWKPLTSEWKGPNAPRVRHLGIYGGELKAGKMQTPQRKKKNNIPVRRAGQSRSVRRPRAFTDVTYSTAKKAKPALDYADSEYETSQSVEWPLNAYAAAASPEDGDRDSQTTQEWDG